ncbi:MULTISPECIES: hypothetical protein [Vibrio]|uniref:hypothetical protein n=1 Tax=Vibrio TaxID=662 RepID=UPI0013620EA7|nr:MULTISPECIES: hypothetical protein [Vibrio]
MGIINFIKSILNIFSDRFFLCEEELKEINNILSEEEIDFINRVISNEVGDD